MRPKTSSPSAIVNVIHQSLWLHKLAFSPTASDSQSEPFGLVVRRDGLICLVVIQNLFQLLALSLFFGLVLGE